MFHQFNTDTNPIMTNSKLNSILLALLALAAAAFPVEVQAQNTNAPGVEHKEAKTRKPPAVTPFHGKLKAVDKIAKTISVGELTIQITSETKILKEEKPAMLEDGVVGETVSGGYKKTADGKLDATKVTFGEKPGEPNKEKTKDKAKDKTKEKAKDEM